MPYLLGDLAIACARSPDKGAVMELLKLMISEARQRREGKAK